MSLNLQEILETNEALLEGHFLLTSGRHSDRYIEKFRLLEQPAALDQVAAAMAEGNPPGSIDVVLGAAIGGILLAGAVARQLECRSMFTERVEGKMALRRGFTLSPDERVLIVEDIVTTGGSVSEILDVVHESGSDLREVICLVDRSERGIDFGVPARALLRLPIASWQPDECPLCQAGKPLIKPGRSGKK
ncbi:orotate phosphoribosyltransferase [Candidatus Neomarinimicrobiota bacterium]